MQLDLNDLKPQESIFSLSDHPGKTFTLRKFSLAVQIWLRDRFGKDNIKEIFTNQSMPEISELAHYLVKEKDTFPTVLSLQEAIVTQADRVALMSAVIQTIGISQPMLDKLAKESPEGNAPAPTGA